MKRIEKMDLETLRQLHRAGLLDDAKAGYLALLRKKPNEAEALHALGIIATQQKNYGEGIEYLQKAIQYRPHDPTLALHLANVLKLQGLFSQATQVLEKIVQTHPDYLPAYNNLGTIYYDLGKLDDAISYFRLAVKKQPDYADAYYNLGLALAKKNHFSEAIETYQTLLKNHPDHFAAHFHLACTLMRDEKIDDAIRQFLIIEAKYPNHLETQMNMATCYLKKGNFNEAKMHYQKALDFAPDDIQLHFNLGIINMQQGNIDRAIQHYQQVVKVNPDHFPAHNNLGAAFLSKQHIGFALQHYQEAFRIQPKNEAILHTIKFLSENQHLLASPPDYITSLFDAYADHYESHLLHALDYQVPTILYEALVKSASLPSHALAILDIGCGTGLCGNLFKPYAKKLVGIDLSPNMLAVAKQKNTYDELIVDDFTSYLKGQKNNFDLIIAGDALVYTGELNELFHYAHVALLPHGLFVFNLEITDKPNFHMNQSGRFSHQKEYIDTLAEQSHFKILYYQTTITRQQNNEPVYGHVYVLKIKQ